jgi:hypothetical protein
VPPRRRNIEFVLEPIAGSDPLLAVRHVVAAGAGDRAARRAHHDGELVRLRRGAYADAADWQERGDGERYDLRIAAVLATRRSDVVLSHHSAARVWGLPLLDAWPTAVHITEPLDSSRRTKNGVRVHRLPLPAHSVGRVGDLLVTSLPRTLVDLARAASFRDAVTAIDFARSPAGGRCAAEALHLELGSSDLKGATRALRAIGFSTDLSMSPLESLSRVVIAELGFPAPELQKAVRTRSGTRLLDFWWERERVAGECDGRVKYFDDRYTAGRTAAEVLWDEKLRENELGEVGIRVARWTWRDCFDPERLIARLRLAGLRQSRTAPRVVGR